MDEPRKTGKAWKAFSVKNGKLYPPQAPNENGAETILDDRWHRAFENPIAGYSSEGYPYIRGRKGQKLALRPGWHLGELPLAKQFSTKRNDETGYAGGELPEHIVWALMDYDADRDYGPEAYERGFMRWRRNPDPEEYRSDKWDRTHASLPYLPDGGFYRYRTNPDPNTDPWIITDKIRLDHLADDYEVAEYLRSRGIEPPMRRGGYKTLSELGLAEYDPEYLFGRGFEPKK